MATYPATIIRYRHTAGLLGIFGGTLGLHNFYLGKRDLAMIQLLITILGSFLFGLGAIVTFIWGIVEGVQILTRQVTLDGDGQPIADPDLSQGNGKSKILAGVLGIFLGSYGVHNFYLGYTAKAIAQLLLTTLGSIIGIGPIIAAVWGVIEGVQILSGTIKTDAEGNPLLDPANNGTMTKSKTAAGILAMFFGTLGIHNFYLGNTGKAVAQLLITLLGSCVIVGPIVTLVWSYVEGISILSGRVTMDANGRELIPD